MSQKPTTQPTDSQAPKVTTCEASQVSDHTDVPPIVSAKTPKDIIQLAQLYDESTTLPNKSNHAPELLLAHPDFAAHMKAFMYNVWDNLGAKIIINNVYRTPTKSNAMIAKYKKYIADGGDPRNKVRPSTTSFHLYGMAMDFNPTLKDGTLLGKSSKSYGKNSLPKAWNDSGIVAQGQSVNLYWGGVWKGNSYDPIHFDFRNVAGTSASVKSLVKQQNVEPNRVILSSPPTS